MTDAISIGVQIGGPEAVIVGDAKVGLYQALARHMTGTHCLAIDSYELVLRVDGSLQAFGDEGLAKLRFAKKRRYITVDIQIPEAVWTTKSQAQLRHYLLAQVGKALELCISHLQRSGVATYESAFWAEFQSAAEEYAGVTNTGLLR